MWILDLTCSFKNIQDLPQIFKSRSKSKSALNFRFKSRFGAKSCLDLLSIQLTEKKEMNVEYISCEFYLFI